MSKETENLVKKPTIYNLGQKQISLDDYIYNLGTNVEEYLNSQTKWSQGLKEEFKNAYMQYLEGLKDLQSNNTNRFRTDDFGSIIDSKGILNDDFSNYYDEAGNKITESDFNLLNLKDLKKYKKFTANSKVADYFSLIGSYLSDIKEKSPDKIEKFDIQRHGLSPYMLYKMFPDGKVNPKNILGMDKYNSETKTRDFTNRLAYISQSGKNHLLDLGKYDFKDNMSYKNEDEYRKTIQTLIDNIDKGVYNNSNINDLILDLRKAGFGDDLITAITSSEETPYFSSEDITKKKQEELERVKKEEEQKKRDYIKDALEIFRRNHYQYTTKSPFYVGDIDSNFWTKEKGFNGDAFRNSVEPGFDYNNYINNYLVNPFDTKTSPKALAALAGWNQLRPITSGNLKGMYYINLPDVLEQTNSALVYNPIDKTLSYAFVGDIPDLWNTRIQKYNEMNNIVNPEDPYMFKEGGSILIMSLGGGFDANKWMEDDRIRALTERGELNLLNTTYQEGRTPEQLEAGERQPQMNPTDLNPNNGLKTSDTVRLATIGADIASMIASFVPTVGTVASAGLGVGSSLGTFAADWMEDGLDWGDAKNLVANLGMDFLGIIPGGGAASKLSKITKNLKKYTPMIISTIGTMHTLSNGSLIIDSYLKLMSNHKEMTVDDWRNISAGLGVLTGGVGAFKRYKDSKKKLNESKRDDLAAVEMLNEKGEKKVVAFSGDDAKQIKKARESGNIDALKQVTTGKYEDYKDWKLVQDSDWGWQGFKNNGKYQLNPFGKKDGNAHIFDVSNDNKGLYAETKGFANPDVRIDKPVGKEEGMLNIPTLKEVTKLFDDKIKEMTDSMLQASKKHEESVKSAQDKYDSEVNTSKENAEKLESLNKKKLEHEKDSKNPELTQEELELIDTLTKSSKVSKDKIKKLEAKLLKLKGKHTKEYEEFKSKYVKGEGDDATVTITGENNRKLTKKFKEILDSVGIKYKRGGSILRMLNGSVMPRGLKNKWLLIDNNLQNATNSNSWNDYYDMDGISEDFQGKLSDENSDTFVNSMNTLNSMKLPWNAKVNDRGYRDWNTEYDKTGLNTYFGKDESRFDYMGPSTWNRNLLLRQLQSKYNKSNPLKTNSFNVYYDGKNWIKDQIVKLVNNPLEESVEESVTAKSPIEKRDTNVSYNVPRKISSTLIYGLPAANVADRVNKINTNLMKDSEIPFLLNPFNYNRFVMGNLKAREDGWKGYSTLMNMLKHPLTSDADRQESVLLQTLVEALNLVDKGNMIDDNDKKASLELNWQLGKENAKNNHDIAALNRLSQLKTKRNLALHDAAYNSKKFTIYDSLRQQIEQEVKNKEVLNKLLNDYYAQLDIENSVNYGLSDYNNELNPKSLRVWNEVLSGRKLISDLSKEEFNDYLNASKAALMAKYELLRKYHGIPTTPWSNFKINYNWFNPKIKQTLFVKNGGKTDYLAIAGIKAKTEDAKMFLKLLKEFIDRNEKLIDRLSKSLYGYIKGSIK